MQKIIVEIKNGLIQDIKNIPSGTQIVVRDYDISRIEVECPSCGGTGLHTEEATDDEVVKDEDGKKCYESYWPA